MSAILTAQEIFDKVAQHLRSMKTRSVDYRGFNDSMCAIGCLISDEDYNSDMEGESVTFVVDVYKHLTSVAAIEPHLDLLVCLQELHDDDGYWGGKGFDGEIALSEIANTFNLVYLAPVKDTGSAL